MLVLDYPSKKEMKEQVGEPLRYMETSMFGPEYRADGTFCGCNRPHITGHKREFFAEVTMKDGKIFKIN
jgi:hypothetical protein